jgi:predicted AAA+ superfamily ATPase
LSGPRQVGKTTLALRLIHASLVSSSTRSISTRAGGIW